MTLLAWALNIVALCAVAGLLIGGVWLWDRMNNRSKHD